MNFLKSPLNTGLISLGAVHHRIVAVGRDAEVATACVQLWQEVSRFVLPFAVPAPRHVKCCKCCSPSFRMTSAIWATFTMFYGIRMEEHTRRARMPHVNGNMVGKQKKSVEKGGVQTRAIARLPPPCWSGQVPSCRTGRRIARGGDAPACARRTGRGG